MNGYDKWLCIMYLYLKLLVDDSDAFISTDDIEQPNLRLIRTDTVQQTGNELVVGNRLWKVWDKAKSF